MLKITSLFPFKNVYGVKGFSPLHAISGFDPIKSVPVDYMHCVLLGVVKKLAYLWVDSSNCKEPWYEHTSQYTKLYGFYTSTYLL